MERFLYRLAKSKDAGRFILKGALMLQVWQSPESRPTMDIDLLGTIPWDSLDNRPVIGFSDATVLHISLFKAGIVSVHGPGLASLGADDQSVMRSVGMHSDPLLCEGRDTRLPGQLLCGPAKAIRGRLIGGNLTAIASLAGTRHALKADGAIVVLEDVNEPTYKIERCLWQLIESNALAGAAGIGFGELTGCDRNDENADSLQEAVRELVEPLAVPVLWDLPIGHGRRNIAFRQRSGRGRSRAPLATF